MKKFFGFNLLWIPAFAGMTKKLLAGMTMLLFVGMALFTDAAWANNIAVSSVTITSQNAANKTANVQFNITWANSWMNAINNDAAWVFIKYSTDGGVTWNHATLKATGGTATSSGNGLINPTGYSSGSGTGLNIIVPTEATSGKKGAFVQRSSNGTGTVTATGVNFVWDWNADGLSASTTALVKVFAIEMVYIPQGSFYVGTPTANVNGLTSPFYTYGSTTPYQITSEGAITIGTTNGNLYYASSTYGGDQTGSLSTNVSGGGFPKGYAAFYMMKYDVSQGQYRDFLNTLTRAQQETRVAAGISTTTAGNYFVMSNSSTVAYRDGIAVASLTLPASPTPVTFGCDQNGNHTLNEAADGEWIAANDLSYMDGAAYAAWAGLRPFTELEYEKAARGTNAVVDGEYAWGASTGLVNATAFSGSTSGTNSETTTGTGTPNCLITGGISGPVRVGNFAASSTTRAQAGASYYGVMDLSGNVWKRPVTVGSANGRLFTGSNGTGVLATDGNAKNSDWPGYTVGTTEVDGGTGTCGYRGGAWYYASTNARVSDRYYAAYVISSRDNGFGARFARTSP